MRENTSFWPDSFISVDFLPKCILSVWYVASISVNCYLIRLSISATLHATKCINVCLIYWQYSSRWKKRTRFAVTLEDEVHILFSPQIAHFFGFGSAKYNFQKCIKAGHAHKFQSCIPYRHRVDTWCMSTRGGGLNCHFWLIVSICSASLCSTSHLKPWYALSFHNRLTL